MAFSGLWKVSVDFKNGPATVYEKEETPKLSFNQETPSHVLWHSLPDCKDRTRWDSSTDEKHHQAMYFLGLDSVRQVSPKLASAYIGFIVFLPMILHWNLPEASAALAHGHGDTQQLGDKLFSNFDWKHLPHIEAFVVKESGSALDVQFVETPLLNLKSRMKDCPNSCTSPRFQDLLHLKWFWKMIYKPFVCSNKSK